MVSKLNFEICDFGKKLLIFFGSKASLELFHCEVGGGPDFWNQKDSSFPAELKWLFQCLAFDSFRSLAARFGREKGLS